MGILRHTQAREHFFHALSPLLFHPRPHCAIKMKSDMSESGSVCGTPLEHSLDQNNNQVPIATSTPIRNSPRVGLKNRSDPKVTLALEQKNRVKSDSLKKQKINETRDILW